mgnify:CR=1 FL=1
MKAVTEVLEAFLANQRGVRVVSHGHVSLVGLQVRRPGRVPFLTFDEALDRGLVQVEEVGAGGVVAECRVRSSSDERLLVVEGEEIRGAKQNRIVNDTILLESRCDTVVPVSCVERKRWSPRTATFSKGSRASSSMLRVLKSSVTHSLRTGSECRSDQAAVWQEAAECLAASRVGSPTESLSDAYETRRVEVDALARRLDDLDACSGYAVFHGDDLVACDLFDRVETLQRLRPRIIPSLAFDALYRPRATGPRARSENDLLSATFHRLEAALAGGATSHASPGLGSTLRFESEGLTASALVHEGEVLHLGVARL